MGTWPPFHPYPLPAAQRAPVFSVYISSASGTAEAELGEGKGRGIFRPDHDSLPPAGSYGQQQPQPHAHKGAFPVLPAPTPAAATTSPRQKGPTLGHQALARPLLLAGGKGEGTPRHSHLAQLLTVFCGRFHGRHLALPQLSLQLLEALSQALQLGDAAASVATQPLLLGLFVRHFHTPLRRVRTWVT